jgi:two-component system sensor histidine kinase KdpD
MGLAIARGIIEIHNGKIWAENLLAGGTAFKFSIPVEYKDISEFVLAEDL